MTTTPTPGAGTHFIIEKLGESFMQAEKAIAELTQGNEFLRGVIGAAKDELEKHGRTILDDGKIADVDGAPSPEVESAPNPAPTGSTQETT